MPSIHTIVVADDEPHVRYILELKLRSAGYQVHLASDGQEAFELVQKYRPQLVITDFEMPGMTGDELGLALQADARTAGTPLFMLTARGHRIPQQRLKQANVVRLMDKPFSVSALLRDIEAFSDSDAISRCENAA